MTDKKVLPPAGQVTSGWLLVERIDGTRSWQIKCVECGGVSVASSITVGKSLGLGQGMPACDTCDVLGRKVTDRMFDLERFSEPGDFPPVQPVEPMPEIVFPSAHPGARTCALDESDDCDDIEHDDSPDDEVVPTEHAMRSLLLNKMAGSTRSAQAAPGPSEIGGCERRLAHRMVFGAKDRREDASAWRPQVGTFGHAGLAEWFSEWTGSNEYGNESRWMPDVRVTSPIAGTLDLYDKATRTVIDFKFVGITTLKDARRGRISDKYLTQLALYGLGMVQGGHAVKTLALWFLPSAGSLDDAVYVEWPYNERVAWAAVAKRDRIQARISEARADGTDPASILPLMSTTEDYCRSCPALGAHCSGAKGDVAPGSLGLELVR